MDSKYVTTLFGECPVLGTPTVVLTYDEWTARRGLALNGWVISTELGHFEIHYVVFCVEVVTPTAMIQYWSRPPTCMHTLPTRMDATSGSKKKYYANSQNSKLERCDHFKLGRSLFPSNYGQQMWEIRTRSESNPGMKKWVAYNLSQRAREQGLMEEYSGETNGSKWNTICSLVRSTRSKWLTGHGVCSLSHWPLHSDEELGCDRKQFKHHHQPPARSPVRPSIRPHTLDRYSFLLRYHSAVHQQTFSCDLDTLGRSAVQVN